MKLCQGAYDIHHVLVYYMAHEFNSKSCVLGFLIVITIFVDVGFFQHFETVTNIRTWINHTDIGECCKMQIL